MSPALYDIWEDPKLRPRWQLQLVGYVAMFFTEEAAQRYADSVKIERKKQGLK